MERSLQGKFGINAYRLTYIYSNRMLKDLRELPLEWEEISNQTLVCHGGLDSSILEMIISLNSFHN